MTLTFTRALHITIAALALGACAPEFEPSADYKGGYLWDNGQTRRITVAQGDSIYAISRRYDVPTPVIAARNGLRYPYPLTPGQVLILDPVRTHRVAAGETIQSIADKYQVPRANLVEVNELRAPYQVTEGQELWIPDPFTVAAAPQRRADEPPPPVAAPRPVITSSNLAPPPGATAMPGSPGGPPPGQQPFTMAAPPQPDTAALSQQIPADTNVPPMPLPRPPAIPTAPAPPSPPPQEASMSMPPAVSPPVAPVPAAPAPSAAPLAPMPASPPIVAAAPAAPAPTLLAAPEQQASLPPAAEPHFIWPVKGRLLSGFGPAGKGLHNDGINIGAPQGAQVRAADAGEVAYAGDGLKSFGNLLLIRHDSGLTTAYAHNDKLLVAKGDKVKQGQVIATVGKSGNVDKPQLHFEVRRGTQAVDPQPFLNR